MENKIPTLKEIARRLNFSISTVSRALNDHPSIGLRTKTQIKKLAKELGYEPNKAAQLFKQQKSNIIGVILPTLKEDFFSQALDAIQEVAKINGYSVLIDQSHDSVDQEIGIVKSMKEQRVDGLIVSLSKFTSHYDHFLELEKYNIPLVFFDRVPSSPDFHRVSSNFVSGTEIAMSFLFDKGHKYIGILNGPEEMKSTKTRIRIYQELLQKKRIKIDMRLVENTDLTKEGTIKAMEKLLSLRRPPTAIITVNDLVALDAIQYAKSKKLKINKDLVFVSYANLPITHYLQSPPLASVEQYPFKQAKRATEILFDLINEKENKSGEDLSFQNVLIEGDLIIHKMK